MSKDQEEPTPERVAERQTGPGVVTDKRAYGQAATAADALNLVIKPGSDGKPTATSSDSPKTSGSSKKNE